MQLRLPMHHCELISPSDSPEWTTLNNLRIRSAAHTAPLPKALCWTLSLAAWFRLLLCPEQDNRSDLYLEPKEVISAIFRDRVARQNLVVGCIILCAFLREWAAVIVSRAAVSTNTSAVQSTHKKRSSA